MEMAHKRRFFHTPEGDTIERIRRQQQRPNRFWILYSGGHGCN